jgi:hypothetical protein
MVLVENDARDDGNNDSDNLELVLHDKYSTTLHVKVQGELMVGLEPTVSCIQSRGIAIMLHQRVTFNSHGNCTRPVPVI